MLKIENRLRQIFYIFFIFCFSWLFLNVIFNNMHFSFNPVAVVAIGLAWFIFLYFIYIIINRYQHILLKREKLCLAVFFVVLGITQLFFYSQLASYPTRDLENVFRGAFYYTITGKVDPLNIDYFYKHPNNLPLMVVFQYIFRAFRKLGFDSYESFIHISAVLNGIAIMTAYLFTYLSVKKLVGIKTGFFSLILLYFCLPLQFIISVFYTDTLTMAFIPFGIYMYLCFSEADKAKTKIIYLLAAGTVISFGVNIKYSVVIIFVAILVDMVLKADWKFVSVAVVGFTLMFFLWQGLFNSFIYKNILDKEKAKDAATPFSSYIMMGLNGDGAFNVDDRMFAWAFSTKEEKLEKIAQQIKYRLSLHTPASFLSFLNQKSVRSFGSANMEYDFTAANSPMRQTPMVDCISKDGKFYKITSHVVQGYHVMLFTLVIICAAIMLKIKSNKFFVPLLGIFGLFLFLLLWEASQRYLVNYFPCYIICASYSMLSIYNKVYKEKLSNKTKILVKS